MTDKIYTPADLGLPDDKRHHQLCDTFSHLGQAYVFGDNGEGDIGTVIAAFRILNVPILEILFSQQTTRADLLGITGIEYTGYSFRTHAYQQTGAHVVLRGLDTVGEKHAQELFQPVLLTVRSAPKGPIVSLREDLAALHPRIKEALDESDFMPIMHIH